LLAVKALFGLFFTKINRRKVRLTRVAKGR